MYNPPAFREDRPDILYGLIRAARLAVLVSNGAGGVPDVTHLPMTLVEADGVLIGHVARANPHWQALRAASRALAVFQGAEGYVSPNWYPSKAEHHRVVPTWNYEAVHAEGPVEVIEDPERLHAIVALLTNAKEASQPRPWSVDDAPAPFVAGQLKGIVGITLRIERLEGKRKLSQNRAGPDRAGAEQGLAASADPRDRAVAAAMRAVAPPEG